MHKILVVDDDVYGREILKTRLEHEGFGVIEAANGEEAKKQADENDCSLIILDVMMPKENGWQVCKFLKNSDRTKNVPVIMLTALAQPIDELRSFESGADAYVTKPVEHKGLIETINKLLKR